MYGAVPPVTLALTMTVPPAWNGEVRLATTDTESGARWATTSRTVLATAVSPKASETETEKT